MLPDILQIRDHFFGRRVSVNTCQGWIGFQIPSLGGGLEDPFYGMGKNILVFFFSDPQRGDIPVHGHAGNKFSFMVYGNGREMDLHLGAVGFLADGFLLVESTAGNAHVDIVSFVANRFGNNESIQVFSRDGGVEESELFAKGLIGPENATLFILENNGTGRSVH